MRRLCASVLILTLSGCASTGMDRPSGRAASATKECTRFTAAARVYGEVYSPMRFQKHSIEACKHGDLNNCVAAPIAIPVMALLAVGSVPFVFPILMANDNIYHKECPQQSPDKTEPPARPLQT